MPVSSLLFSFKIVIVVLWLSSSNVKLLAALKDDLEEMFQPGKWNEILYKDLKKFWNNT